MKDVWLRPKTRVGCMKSGVIEDGNIQVDVHGDKLHVSLNEPPVRGDGPLEGLDLSGLDGSPLQSRVDQLFRQYRTVFAGSSDVPGKSEVVQHRIPLDGGHVPAQPYRRVAWAQMEELLQHLRQLLAKDIIRPSCSSYSSPEVLVRKKSGELRMCVEYRGLNARTVKDAYPLPRIDAVSRRPRRSCHFQYDGLAVRQLSSRDRRGGQGEDCLHHPNWAIRV